MNVSTRYSALVVDDEPLSRRRIRQLMHSAPDFAIVGECEDGAQVADAVRALRPHVVFLDVRMTQMNGFAALESVRDLVRHVVFVTAFPEHASRAFDVAAVDYLVKPVSRERFAAALDRVRRACEGDSSPRILLSTLGGALSVPTREIDWLEADGAYVVVHIGARRHVLRESLAALLTRLGAARFARVHRSAGVNLDRVEGIRRARNHGLEVALMDGMRIPVSRRRAAELRERLDTGKALGVRPSATKTDR